MTRIPGLRELLLLMLLLLLVLIIVVMHLMKTGIVVAVSGDALVSSVAGCSWATAFILVELFHHWAW